MIGELTIRYLDSISLHDLDRLVREVYYALDRTLDEMDYPEFDMTSMTITEVPYSYMDAVEDAVWHLRIDAVRLVLYIAYDMERDE